MKNDSTRWFLILLLFILIALLYTCRREEGPAPGSQEPGPGGEAATLLRNGAGIETIDFQPLDTVMLAATRLQPRTGYEITVIRDDGVQVAENRLSTDSQGRILDAPIWFGVGSRSCPEERPRAHAEAAARIDDAVDVIPDPVDFSMVNRRYRIVMRLGDRVVREYGFHVAAALSRPTLYATDARGCPKTGFLIGEEDVWVRGKNFPPGSIVRLWAVPAQDTWHAGDALKDRTRRYGDQAPPVFELAAGTRSFQRLLWPKGQTSVGSYDIVAEAVDYPVGHYQARSEARVQQIVANIPTSGFVVQRRPEAGQPLEMDIAGSLQSPFAFRGVFLPDENVYVGVDSLIQPAYVGKTADVYIVPHQTEAQWVNDPWLKNATVDKDVTGFVEKLTVNGICGNFWKTLAWPAPLAVGEYDVVLDFDQNGRYDSGVDLIDALDPIGFTVAELRVDTVSFNYPGAGAVALYDENAKAAVGAPEFVSAGNAVKPAAWIKGGSHSVQVAFRAMPSVTTAQVWAEDGLGGLAGSGSPSTVSFSGGNGQATFNVNSPPAAVAKTEFTWHWRYKNVNGAGTPTQSMGETGRHLLYSVLAAPKVPQATPWVGALDVATQVAAGKTTPEEATRAIWDDFYRNAGGSYDSVGGAPRYASNGGAGDFNLTNWLANYHGGGIGTVNCYDMGNAVSVFANALGADTVYTFVGPFGYLNCIKPIGLGCTNNPFDSANPTPGGDSFRTYFGNHGFTRLKPGLQIFDASVGQVDNDGNVDDCQSTCQDFQGYDLDGRDTWNASYRNRVIDDTPASTPGMPMDKPFGVK